MTLKDRTWITIVVAGIACSTGVGGNNIMIEKRLLEISRNPKYQKLVRTRNFYGWSLTAVMMLVYYGYIYLVAFKRDYLAQTIGEGVMTLSIPIGLGVIVFTIIITGIYVRRANAEFDKLTQEILQETK